ncbi:hypothetical protein MKX01_025916 [Papaver californicum]|nr:hypothetical protein MKX01_025916 [Papaver californicum]
MSLPNDNTYESGSRSSIPQQLCKKGCRFFGSVSTETSNFARLTINDCHVNEPEKDSSHVNKPTENSSSCASITTGSVVLNNQCSTCNKRVKLIGYNCRCGNIYYPKHHVGRDMIITTNPLVKQDKLMERI